MSCVSRNEREGNVSPSLGARPRQSFFSPPQFHVEQRGVDLLLVYGQQGIPCGRAWPDDFVTGIAQQRQHSPPLSATRPQPIRILAVTDFSYGCRSKDISTFKPPESKKVSTLPLRRYSISPLIRVRPNPWWSGCSTAGPPFSDHVSSKRALLAVHSMLTVPFWALSAPYFEALVASSWDCHADRKRLLRGQAHIWTRHAEARLIEGCGLRPHQFSHGGTLPVGFGQQSVGTLPWHGGGRSMPP